jgi:small subunit ribosomal protein S6e
MDKVSSSFLGVFLLSGGTLLGSIFLKELLIGLSSIAGGLDSIDLASLEGHLSAYSLLGDHSLDVRGLVVGLVTLLDFAVDDVFADVVKFSVESEGAHDSHASLSSESVRTVGIIALRIVKKGDKDIAGCNDADRPNRLGRKRRMRIVSAFALDRKLDNVCKYVVHRKIEKGDKTYYKAPHVQRMVSEKRVRRKMALKRSKINAVKASCDAAKTYEKLLKEYGAEKRAAREKEHAEKAA